MNIVFRFPKALEPVLDTCASTLATEKAPMQLPEHGRLVGYEKDYTRFLEVLPSLVEVYLKECLRLDSEVAGSEKAAKASMVCVKDMAALLAKKG